MLNAIRKSKSQQRLLVSKDYEFKDLIMKKEPIVIDENSKSFLKSYRAN